MVITHALKNLKYNMLILAQQLRHGKSWKTILFETFYQQEWNYLRKIYFCEYCWRNQLGGQEQDYFLSESPEILSVFSYVSPFLRYFWFLKENFSFAIFSNKIRGSRQTTLFENSKNYVRFNVSFTVFEKFWIFAKNLAFELIGFEIFSFDFELSRIKMDTIFLNFGLNFPRRD